MSWDPLVCFCSKRSGHQALASDVRARASAPTGIRFLSSVDYAFYHHHHHHRHHGLHQQHRSYHRTDRGGDATGDDDDASVDDASDDEACHDTVFVIAVMTGLGASDGIFS